MVVWLVGASVLASVPAFAEPDLRLERLPPRLKMRTAAAPRTDAPASAAIADGGSTSAPAAAGDGQPVDGTALPFGSADGRVQAPAVDAAFSALPRSTRELAERLTFRLRAGVELDSAPASGDALRGGAPLPAGFAESRPWIVGDAMVGARDLLLPSLGGYFLSSFQLDADDSPATRSALVEPGDAADRRIAIKAGYVEWGNDDRRTQPVWLRGGRQFRLDGGALFAYFDGVTAGYRTRGLDMSAFAGRRVVLYVDSEAGTTFGATAAVDVGALRGVPVKLAVDYMGLAIRQPTREDDGDIELRQLIAVTSSYEPSTRLRAELRARLADGGTGGANLALGRLGSRLRLAPSDRVMVIADVEQRWGGDLAYDLAAPSAVDVVDVARKLGVGLGAPIDALTLGAHVDLRHENAELLVFVRTELPEETPVTVDQQGWFEAGAAVAGQAFKGAWLTAQYTGRQYVREAAAAAMGSAFGDTAGAGLDRLHELSLDATLRSQGRGAMRWRASLGGFYRSYDLVTPYRTADRDGRAGGRVDLQWWLSKAIHVDVAAEVAEASPVLARELGTLSSLRGALEAQW